MKCFDDCRPLNLPVTAGGSCHAPLELLRDGLAKRCSPCPSVFGVDMGEAQVIVSSCCQDSCPTALVTSGSLGSVAGAVNTEGKLVFGN